MDMKALSQEHRELLERLLEGKAEDVENGVEKAKEILDTVLGSKAEAVVQEDATTPENLTEVFEVIAEQFKAVYSKLDAVIQRLDLAEVALKAVQTTEDEKVAETISGNDWAAAFRNIGQQSVEKAVAKEDVKDAAKIEELKNKAKSGVIDADITAENPLAFAFKQFLTG